VKFNELLKLVWT